MFVKAFVIDSKFVHFCRVVELIRHSKYFFYYTLVSQIFEYSISYLPLICEILLDRDIIDYNYREHYRLEANMTQEEIEKLFERLKNGELKEVYVSKEEFLPVREVLVNREDFKNFRGIAQHGGAVIYQYVEVARS